MKSRGSEKPRRPPEGGRQRHLKTLGEEVTAYYDQLDTARQAQQGKEGMATGSSDNITPARAAAAIALYANLGALMNIYAATPINVAGFFDLETLRKGDNEEDEPPVPPIPPVTPTP